MNIFNLTGPEFLQLYLFLFAIAALTAWVLPHLFRGPFDVPQQAGRDLDPFEIAYLMGGPVCAIRAALVALYNRGLLTADGAMHAFTRTRAKIPHDLSPTESFVLTQIVTPATKSADLFKVSIPQSLTARLFDQQLLLSAGRRGLAVLLRMAPLLILLAIGGYKFSLGLSRGRPVGFLIILLIATVVIAFRAARRIPRTTRRGARTLKSLRRVHSAFEFASQRRKQDALNWSDEALAMALFGIGSLGFGSQIALALEIPRTQNGWNWGTGNCSGGCGSSSCGGGGGCGGGGCGGCGGGGGD